VQSISNNNLTGYPDNLFDNPLSGQAAAAPTGPVTLTSSGTPAFRVPNYKDFNLSVQHEVMRNTVAEIGYVGTVGTHLLGEVDLNQPSVAMRTANVGSDTNAIRPYLGYGPIVSRATIFTSNYNSLQMSLNRRMSKGLTLGAAYTWSKLLTTNPADRGVLAYDTYNLKQSYGLSTINTPQMLVFSYIYDFPFYQNQRGLVGHVLGGWEWSGITTIESGQSTTVTQALDPWQLDPAYPGGLGLSRLPWWTAPAIAVDQIGNPKGPKTALQYFNTAAFVPAVDHFGGEHVGTVLGPGYQIWDMSLFKNINFGERAGLQLRLEAFNTFNHGSPSSINTSINDPSLGLISPNFGAVNGWHMERQVQLGAKIKF
jgi:hypothetical protein